MLRPAEGDPDQGRAVVVAPADPGRRLLVRDQPEERGGHGVAEGGEGRGVVDEAADQAQSLGRQRAVRRRHDVAAVADQLEVEVEAVPGHPLLDLGGEGGEHAVAVRDVADDPAGERHEVAHLLDRPGQQLDLVLLGAPPGQQRQVGADRVDVADLGVRVLDRARDLGEVADHLVDDLAALEEGRRRVVAHLALGAVVLGPALADQEELELAEGVQLEARAVVEPAVGDREDVVRGEGRQRAVAIEKPAHEVEAQGIEGAQERGGVARHDVEVGGGGVHQPLEQGRAVDPLARGQDPLRLLVAGEGELELAQLAVEAGVVEGQALDALLAHHSQHVGAGEVGAVLVENQGQRIGERGMFGHGLTSRAAGSRPHREPSAGADGKSSGAGR